MVMKLSFASTTHFVLKLNRKKKVGIVVIYIYLGKEKSAAVLKTILKPIVLQYTRP